MGRYALYIGIVLALVAYFSMSDKLIMQRDLLNDFMVFKYSRAKKLLSIMNFLLWVIAAIAYLEYVVKISEDDVIIVVIASALAVPFYILEAYKAFGITFKINHNGITKQSWLKPVEINWQEIHGIKFENRYQIRERTGCFVILSHKKKLILCSNIEGLRGLALAIKDNLPPDKWKLSESAVEEILAQNMALQE
ncbi:MAG: hypothetical protein QME41_01950 [Actinomycetota bacterium]|nr:hypothetical protein [Actinomycetota bacterium]